MGGMGFRDIHTFNLAMLGKQAWRIWSNSDSLVSRCLRAKYFATSDFLSADLGSCPSYLWRSVMAGRDVLTMGLRFRVGDGETILAFDSKWIPRPISFKPITANPFAPWDFHVCDLIDWDLLKWRHDLLLQIYLPMDVEEIMKIPLSYERPLDKLVWHFTKNGEYTVKSANRMLRNHLPQRHDQVSTSCQSRMTTFWKNLWSLKCLPKAKLFAWRAASSILPTAMNLAKRALAIPANCVICGAHSEDDLHALFHCSWATNIWNQSRSGMRVGKLKATCFQELLQLVFQWPEENDVACFIHMCWLIWKHRCAFTFGRDVNAKLNLEGEAQALTARLLHADQNNFMPTVPHDDAWQPPLSNQLSINVDAAFRSDGVRTAGTILRDCIGQVTTATTTCLPFGIEVDHGELLAIYHGLVLAQSLVATDVIVWSDSLTCVNLLNGSMPKFHPLAALLMDCRRIANSFGTCIFRFVRRQGNMPTHLLATYGLNYEDSVNWTRNLSVCILSALHADLFPME